MTKLYRVTLPVTNIDEATRFYRALLSHDGERMSAGWHYFDCDGVLLACYDARAEDDPAPPAPHTAPVFLSTDELLAQLRQRALAHGGRLIGEEISTLPTGEEGLTLQDPFGNALCLVKAGSVQRSRSGARPAGTTRSAAVLLFKQEFLNAVKGGEFARVKELLTMDPDLAHATDAAGVSVVLMAAYKRNTRIASYLLAYRDDLSIWEAAAVGHRERLAILLDEDGSLLNRPAQDGYIPLGLACFFGHPDCVALLLERGADVNAVSRNAMRLRPLHSAVTHDDLEKAVQIVAQLLRAGADVNAVQERGYTPLHRAADRGSRELVGLLLRAGADLQLRSESGRTAADLAAAKAHQDVVELLRLP